MADASPSQSAPRLDCLWVPFLAALALCALPFPVQAEQKWLWLDNGKIRLGVDEAAGGCLGWLATSAKDVNILNTFDRGRYLQQSYYGDSDGSDWNGQPWRYNPVQGGSWKNAPALLLESRAEAKSLYQKTRPRHWATGDLLEEVVMEQWLYLEGDVARLKFRLIYSGTKSHAPRHQELPALFVQPQYDSLICVAADGSLNRHQPGFPNERFPVTGGWLAWVNAQNEGVGLWCPHVQEVTCYRVRNGNQGDCSYAAPLKTFALTPGLQFEYETALVVGSLDKIKQAMEILNKGRGSP